MGFMISLALLRLRGVNIADGLAHPAAKPQYVGFKQTLRKGNLWDLQRKIRIK